VCSKKHGEIQQHDQVGLPLAQLEQDEEAHDHDRQVSHDTEEGNRNPACHSLGEHRDSRDIECDAADRPEVGFKELRRDPNRDDSRRDLDQQFLQREPDYVLGGAGNSSQLRLEPDQEQAENQHQERRLAAGAVLDQSHRQLSGSRPIKELSQQIRLGHGMMPCGAPTRM
jgi:hypothetical protein